MDDFIKNIKDKLLRYNFFQIKLQAQKTGMWYTRKCENIVTKRMLKRLIDIKSLT
jgi:hypothetical protein